MRRVLRETAVRAMAPVLRRVYVPGGRGQCLLVFGGKSLAKLADFGLLQRVPA